MRHKKGYIRGICLLTVICMQCMQVPVSAFTLTNDFIKESEESKKQAEQSKASLKSGLTNVKEVLKSLETQKGDLEGYIQQLDMELTDINAKIDDLTLKIADQETDVVCEKCGRRMVIKFGPHGQFLACPGFPECRNTKPIVEKAGVTCPECGGELIVRRTKKGRRYYGCENYPECKYMTWQKPRAKKTES